MICGQCQKYGAKMRDAMTFEERVTVLTSAAVMYRSVLGGRRLDGPAGKEKDLMVVNSVMAKTLLSFPEETRKQFLTQLSVSTGVDMHHIETCAHGLRLIT